MEQIKRIVLVVLILIGFKMCVSGLHQHQERVLKASDSYVRDRIVKLWGDVGQCTGVIIEAPSHINYILTAAHCKEISSTKTVNVENEVGIKMNSYIILEDPNSDLLLMSNPYPINGIDIAKGYGLYDKVHTITHGGGKPSYRTDGELLDHEQVQVFLSVIHDKSDEDKCVSMPKQRIASMDLFFISIPACIRSTFDSVSTAQVIPGSSGGALLNWKGELLGIVSATDGKFGFFVTLEDIKKFLKDK